jgi:hypothetical protein
MAAWAADGFVMTPKHSESDVFSPGGSKPVNIKFRNGSLDTNPNLMEKTLSFQWQDDPRLQSITKVNLSKIHDDNLSKVMKDYVLDGQILTSSDNNSIHILQQRLVGAPSDEDILCLDGHSNSFQWNSSDPRRRSNVEQPKSSNNPTTLTTFNEILEDDGYDSLDELLFGTTHGILDRMKKTKSFVWDSDAFDPRLEKGEEDNGNSVNIGGNCTVPLYEELLWGVDRGDEEFFERNANKIVKDWIDECNYEFEQASFILEKVFDASEQSSLDHNIRDVFISEMDRIEFSRDASLSAELENSIKVVAKNNNLARIKIIMENLENVIAFSNILTQVEEELNVLQLTKYGAKDLRASLAFIMNSHSGIRINQRILTKFGCGYRAKLDDFDEEGEVEMQLSSASPSPSLSKMAISPFYRDLPEAEPCANPQLNDEYHTLIDSLNVTVDILESSSTDSPTKGSPNSKRSTNNSANVSDNEPLSDREGKKKFGKVGLSFYKSKENTLKERKTKTITKRQGVPIATEDVMITSSAHVAKYHTDHQDSLSESDYDEDDMVDDDSVLRKNPLPKNHPVNRMKNVYRTKISRHIKREINDAYGDANDGDEEDGSEREDDKILSSKMPLRIDGQFIELIECGQL